MRVLVTGAEGYIGSVLVPYLVRAGFEVTGLDTGFYRDGWLYGAGAEGPRRPRIVDRDLRDVGPDDVAGHDAVVHLAELSNDPLGANRPEVTYAINHGGSVALANLARRAGVARFVYTSSCSVYGVSGREFVDEDSPVNPQTAYADCKVLVERDVGAMADEGFVPVFLRNATAYGASPRMRFDIVVNDLCALAWTTKRIAMTSDGSPWRPLVHVEDICEAIRCALTAPADAVRGRVLNVGATDQNFRVREIAEQVAAVFPGCDLLFAAPGADQRSYRVRFERIREAMPGFRCRWQLRRGVEELRDLFRAIGLDETTHRFRAYTRLAQLRWLQSTGRLDADLHWRT